MEEHSLKENLENLSKEINIPEKSSMIVKDPHLNETLPVPPPSLRSRKKKFIVYSGAIIVGLIISSIISYSIFTKAKTNKEIIDKNVAGEEETLKVIPTPVTASGTTLIAYVVDDNLWVTDENASNNTQFTTDGAGYTLDNLVWKDPQILTYSKCSFVKNSCDIIEHNLFTSSVKSIISLTDVEIKTMGWTREGDLLFYHILNRKENKYFTYLFDGSTSKIIKEWPDSVGTGLSLTDEVKFDFNNDSSKILFTNTVTPPGGDFITMFDSKGKDLGSISEISTFGFFKDNSEFYYVSLQELLSSKVEDSIIENFKGLNPTISKDGNQIIFWKYGEKGKSGINNSYIYTINKIEEKLLAPNFIKPEWIDKDTVIGFTIEAKEGIFNYEINGLGRVESNGKDFKQIIPGEVTDFAIFQ